MVHTFLKGISLKVNVIVQMEVKLAYFKATVQHISHYAKGIPHFAKPKIPGFYNF